MQGTIQKHQKDTRSLTTSSSSTNEQLINLSNKNINDK
jgi:hypothetical protein